MKMTKTIQLTRISSILAAGSLLVAAPSALAEDPATVPDDNWLSVSGKVMKVTPDTFELDHANGIVTVEFDDWDNDADAYKLVEGDEVTVTGKIDHDLFETRKIEASTVYVDSINTYFYASAADEEDAFISVITPVDGAHATLQGTVTSIPKADEFIINVGTIGLRVETDEMAYNPLDDEGYQKIEVGDRVSVSGEFDNDFFEGYELVADSIITLSNNS